MEEAEAPDPQPAAPPEPPVLPPPSSQATPPTPSEAIAAIRIRAPTRGNRKLDQLFDAVNAARLEQSITANLLAAYLLGHYTIATVFALQATFLSVTVLLCHLLAS